MSKLIASVTLLAIFSIMPLGAVSKRPVPGLDPLLRVHSQVLTALDLPATTFALEQRDIFISRGGFVQLTYLIGSKDRINPIIKHLRFEATDPGRRVVTLTSQDLRPDNQAGN